MIASFLGAMVFAVVMFILGYGQVNYLQGYGVNPSLVDLEIVGLIILMLAPIFIGGRK